MSGGAGVVRVSTFNILMFLLNFVLSLFYFLNKKNVELRLFRKLNVPKGGKAV